MFTSNLSKYEYYLELKNNKLSNYIALFIGERDIHIRSILFTCYNNNN